MKLSFSTRQAARNFAQQRTANGLRSSVTDNGKEALTAGIKRYSVDVTNGQHYGAYRGQANFHDANKLGNTLADLTALKQAA